MTGPCDGSPPPLLQSGTGETTMDNRGRVSGARGALALAGALAAGAAAVPRADAQPMTTTPVVRTGQAAPGTGSTYAGFSGASVNASGEVLFGATLSGPTV